MNKGTHPRLLVLTMILACSSSSEPDDPGPKVPACARLSACFEFEGVSGGGFDTCLRSLPAQPFGSTGLAGLAGLLAPNSHDPVFDCVIGAEDCEAAGRCINAGAPVAACEAPRCDGDILRTCAGGITAAYDCANDGDSCIESGGLVLCGQPASCTERTSECRDGQPVVCADGVERSSPCDLECIESRGQAICADTSGPACEPGVASARCDGDVAVSCFFGFEMSAVCAPGTCEVTSDGALCRSPRECSSSACEGDVLQACIRGRVEAVDCSEVGARTCQAGEIGARCIL